MGKRRVSRRVEDKALNQVEKEEKKETEHPCKGCVSKAVGGLKPCPSMGCTLFVGHCREVQKLPKMQAWVVILGGAKIVKDNNL